MHALLSDSRQPISTRWVRACTLVAIALLAACSSDVGSARLKAIPKGAHRDAIVSAFGTGPLTAARPADVPRIVNGFRRQMYLTGGQMYEILWYREAPGSLADPIVKERETPVVLQGDTLLLWGWKDFSALAAKINLPDPSHDKARADSIINAQKPSAAVPSATKP